MRYIRKKSKIYQKNTLKKYSLAKNKKTSEMSGGRISSKINELLEKDNVLNKDDKPQKIT